MTVHLCCSGESKKSFKTSNYRLTTSPEFEWKFVTDPYTILDPVPATQDGAMRSKITPEELFAKRAEKITDSLRLGGLVREGCEITTEDVKVHSDQLWLEEIIALRLCTRFARVCFPQSPATVKMS